MVGQKRIQYNHEELRKAASAVKMGMKLYTAEKEYGIPRNTIRDNLNRKTIPSLGKPTVFTKEQELLLRQRVETLAKRGFGLNIVSFRRVAYRFAVELRSNRQLKVIPS